MRRHDSDLENAALEFKPDSVFGRPSGTASPAQRHGTCAHPQSRIDPAIAAADVWQMQPYLPTGRLGRCARHSRGTSFGLQIPFEPSVPSAHQIGRNVPGLLGDSAAFVMSMLRPLMPQELRRISKPRPQGAPPSAARLEGRPQARSCQRPSFETLGAHPSRLACKHASASG